MATDEEKSIVNATTTQQSDIHQHTTENGISEKNTPVDNVNNSDDDQDAIPDPPTLRDLEHAIVDEIKNTIHHQHHPPDGGRKAWGVVFGGFLCLFCTFGFCNAIGVLQSYYETGPLRNHTASQIGWIASAQFFFFFGAMIVGPMFDVIGAQPLLIVGTFFNVLGFMMLSICKDDQFYGFFLCQSFVIGSASAMIFTPAFMSVVTWFVKKRGAAAGIVASGSSIGGVIFPIMIRRLIQDVGFGWALRIAGFLILGLMSIAIFLTHSFHPPKGIKELKNKRFFDYAAFKEKKFALLTFSYFLISFGLFVAFGYLPSYATAIGMSDDMSYYIVAIMNAASVFGRTIPPALADKYGRLNTQGLMVLLSAIIVLCVWLTGTSHAQAIVFASLYGFSTGAYVSLLAVCVAVITPDMRTIGLRSGTVQGVLSFAILGGIPGSGALIKEGVFNYGFGHCQIFSGVFLLAGGLVFVYFRHIVTDGKFFVII